MKTINLKLTLSFTGSIFNRNVSLEGKEITGWIPKDGKFTRDLPQYPIDGTLDVNLRAQGVNGATITLELSDGEQFNQKLTGTIEKGYTNVSKAYEI